MKILGIETSCDDTAAAVVEDGKILRSNAMLSSMDLHVQYGGIVPEVAARSHIESIGLVIQKALGDAQCDWSDIDGIAVTYGAGLGGSLLIGVTAARTLAILHNKPLYAINHVHAHVYANFLQRSLVDGIDISPEIPHFPFISLIVSGGHTQLVLFKDHFRYELLGQTKDDAIGEAFDKVAKILGLPYPGGPSISKLALHGDARSHMFPIANMPGYDFSYSGLKTAVLRAAQAEVGKDHTFPSFKLAEVLSDAQKANLAASFQYIAIKTVVSKTQKAIDEYGCQSIVLAGGVAANIELRTQLAEINNVQLFAPPSQLCTDNGAMVATLGCFMVKTNATQADPYSLTIEPNLSM